MKTMDLCVKLLLALVLAGFMFVIRVILNLLARRTTYVRFSIV